MRRRSLAGGALAAALLTACAEPAPPPNVLVISIDTLRRDHVSAYGYARRTTPRIDQLAADGVLYLDATSTSNWTLPAHMSLMTGLPPGLHRVEDDGNRLAGSVQTLAEAFSSAGYATAGVVSHVYLGAGFGFDRGFDLYRSKTDQRAADVSDQAIAWLKDAGSRPWFLFVHYFDPHWSYDAPQPFATRFGPADRRLGSSRYLLKHLTAEDPVPPAAIPQIQRLYDAEIAYADHHVGRLLDWLRERGQFDRTVVAVLSDHGEELGDHGSFGHGTHMHGEVTRIPMLLRGPGIEARSSDDPVLLSDLPRTLLRLAGLPVAEQFRLRAVDGMAGQPDRVVVAESTRWGPKRFAVRSSSQLLLTGARYSPVGFALVNGRHKAVRLGTRVLPRALFDVRSDPAEQRNLASGPPTPAAARLEAALGAYLDHSHRGLRLDCSATGGSGEFRAHARLSGVLIDEPFSIPAATAHFEPSAGKPDVSFGLDLSNTSTAVFFPLAGRASSVALRLVRDGQSFAASVDIPTGGSAIALEFAGDSAPRCSATAPSLALEVELDSSELSEADIEMLRSLGYVE